MKEVRIRTTSEMVLAGKTNLLREKASASDWAGIEPRPPRWEGSN
jgi:hypothetical protein